MNAPGLTYEQRRELLDASDDPARRSGECAEYAPGLTDKQRAELRRNQ